MSPGLRWAALALLGLVIAGAVALLATRTVSETIGISSEPPTAGESLAPTEAPRKRRSKSDSASSQGSAGGPAPAPAAVPTGDDPEVEIEIEDD